MPRKSTFNATETKKLFEICQKYKHIIESKNIDCVSSKQKDEAWEKITVDFNATNNIKRDLKELKAKYKNVKYSTKSKAAEDRRSIYANGGGPATSSTSLSAAEERMMSMLSDKEVEGIPNNCDSDAVVEAIPENNLTGSNTNSPPLVLETPLPGPATLRTKKSTPLCTGAKVLKSTSWEKLASLKSKWSEAKLQAEVAEAQKEQERVELQIKIMRETHELDLIHKNLEIEILRLRLEREQLEIKKCIKCKYL